MFCFKKDFPCFNHKDTILHKSPIKKERFPNIEKTFSIYKNNNDIKTSCFTHKKNNIRSIFSSKIFKLLEPEQSNVLTKISEKKFPPVSFIDSVNSSLEKEKSRNKANSLHSPPNFLPKIQTSQNHSKNNSHIILVDKTEAFLKYLKFLGNNEFPSRSKLIKSLQVNKKNCVDIPKNETLESEIKLNKKYSSKNQKKASFVLSINISKTKNNISPALNSISPNFNEYSSPKFRSSPKIRKNRGSQILNANPRVFRVKNYQALVDIVQTVSKNIIEFIRIVSNDVKAYKLIIEMIELNKLKYLRKVLLDEEKKYKLKEDLSPSALENSCFFKESQFNIAKQSQIYEEKMISNNIIEDLTIFNEKLESYLIERNIKDMQNLAKDLTANLKNHSYKNIERFNYESMPENSVIDSIIELKNQYGNLDYFDKNEIIIGKSIDEIIKNVKTNNNNEELYFNTIELKKK